jgi:putative polyhydroxyalkanoate system protein
MATIEIERSHKKPMAEARRAIERVAKHIATRFEVSYGWDGDTLHFERSGVNGAIALSKTKVRVTAHLSFLLLAIRGAVEREVRKHLDQEFG